MQIENQSTNTDLPRRKLGAAFALLPISAIILVGLSVWYTFSSFSFYNNGIEVEATVVRLDSKTSTEGVTTYSPVFSYAVDGEQYEYESVNSSSNPSHDVGETAILLYNPDNPGKARINSFWELWLIPCIMCPVSFFMVMLSISIPLSVRQASSTIAE